MIRIAALLRAANPVPRVTPRPPLDAHARAELSHYVPPSHQADDAAPRPRPTRTTRWIWVGATAAGATALTMGVVFLVPGPDPTANADIATARVIEGFPAPTVADPAQWTAGAVVQLDEPNGTTRLVKVWVQARTGDEWARQGDELTYRRSEDGLWVAENDGDGTLPPAAVIPSLTIDRDNGVVSLRVDTNGTDPLFAPIAGGDGVGAGGSALPSAAPEAELEAGLEAGPTEPVAPTAPNATPAPEAQTSPDAAPTTPVTCVVAAGASDEERAQAEADCEWNTHLTVEAFPRPSDPGGQTPLASPTFSTWIESHEPTGLSQTATDLTISDSPSGLPHITIDRAPPVEITAGPPLTIEGTADDAYINVGGSGETYSVFMADSIVIQGTGADAVPWFLEVFTPPVDLDGQLVTTALGTTQDTAEGAAVFYAQADGEDLDAMRATLARLEVTPDGEWTDQELRGVLTSPAEARRGRPSEEAPSPSPSADEDTHVETAHPDAGPSPENPTDTSGGRIYTDGSVWSVEPNVDADGTVRSWPVDAIDCLSRVGGESTESSFIRVVEGQQIVCVDMVDAHGRPANPQPSTD